MLRPKVYLEETWVKLCHVYAHIHKTINPLSWNSIAVYIGLSAQTHNQLEMMATCHKQGNF